VKSRLLERYTARHLSVFRHPYTALYTVENQISADHGGKCSFCNSGSMMELNIYIQEFGVYIYRIKCIEVVGMLPSSELCYVLYL